MIHPATAPSERRRVGIIDDSRTIRALLRATLDADPRLTVVGEASDPYEAREMIKSVNPDVVTLDVEMPRMNGLVFLQHLMRLRPMPVVMVSSRTRENSEDAVQALSLGAVDCVDAARLQGDPLSRRRLSDALFHAASAKVHVRGGPIPKAEAPSSAGYRWNGRFVLIGSSTGGVDALERVLSHYPAEGPPTVVAQHMPPAFLQSFASRLDSLIAPRVRLAAPEIPLMAGTVLIAPGGDHHVALAADAARGVVLRPDDGTHLYVPSVDMLFTSAVPQAHRCLAVVLTGMGKDGAEGAKQLHGAGGHCIVQDAATAVVDGMPKAVRDSGAYDEVCALDAIGLAILRATNAAERRSA
ncbi:MAG: chemotaxis-specific protein-glutamate methyltransferase CheB [Pseudomonadota bacterium]